MWCACPRTCAAARGSRSIVCWLSRAMALPPRPWHWTDAMSDFLPSECGPRGDDASPLHAADAPPQRAADAGLVTIGADGKPHIRVYGAPRPAVPQAVPLTPRFGGCASGAGV